MGLHIIYIFLTLTFTLQVQAARPVADDHQGEGLEASSASEKAMGGYGGYGQGYEDPSFENVNINMQGQGTGGEFDSSEAIEIQGFNIGTDGMLTIADPDDAMGDRSYDAVQLGIELDKSNGSPAGPLAAQLGQPTQSGSIMGKPLFAIQSRKRMQELLLQMFGTQPQAPQANEELIHYIQGQ